MSSSATAAAILNSVLENIKNLPPSSDASSAPSPFAPSSAPRFDSDPYSTSDFGRFADAFRRKTSLHDLLGGGQSADVLLWRKKHLSLSFLGISTAIWVVFEWIGYHFVSLASLLLLIALVVLFVWTNGSSFLSRQPPPVPKLEISEDLVVAIAKTLQIEINRLLATFQEIAVGNDTKRFVKLVGGLSLLVLFGSWFNFLTLVYFVIIAAHSLPVLYEKNEESIHYLAEKALEELKNQFKKLDSSAPSKPRGGPSVEKKEE